MTCCSYFLCLRAPASLHPILRPETCVSSQMLQMFLSIHHSLTSTTTPICFHSFIPAGTAFLRLTSSPSFMDHFHALSLKSPARGTILKMPTWSYFIPPVTLLQGLPFAYRGKYLNQTCIHWWIFKILPFICPNNSPQSLTAYPSFTFPTLAIFPCSHSLECPWLVPLSLHIPRCLPGMPFPLALSLGKAAQAGVQAESHPLCSHCIMDTLAFRVYIPLCLYPCFPSRL